MTINTVRSEELAQVLYDDRTLKPPRTWWLDTFFQSEVRFDTTEVHLSKVVGHAKLAPLRVPTAHGKPIYERAERIETIAPAYLKPKDPIRPDDVMERRAGFGETGPYQIMGSMSPEARLRALRTAILQDHKNAIIRRWEWMAVQAITEGKVVLSGEDYPETVVDFRRDPALDVTLAPADQWTNFGVNVVEQFEAWFDAMLEASFGGPARMVVMGRKAWAALRRNESLKELLDRNLLTTSRPTADLNMRDPADDYISEVGTLRNGIPIYVFSGQYQADDGTWVDYMDARDVVLVGAVSGVRLFGAIQDLNHLRPVPMWPKAWMENDPSVEFLMTQSAPLMFPRGINRTMRIRVVA